MQGLVWLRPSQKGQEYFCWVDTHRISFTEQRNPTSGFPLRALSFCSFTSAVPLCSTLWPLFQRTASWPHLPAAYSSPGGHKTAKGCPVSESPAPKGVILQSKAAAFALSPDLSSDVLSLITGEGIWVSYGRGFMLMITGDLTLQGNAA